MHVDDWDDDDLQLAAALSIRHFRGHSVSEIQKIVGPKHDNNAHMRILQGSSRLPEALERVQTLEDWSRAGWIQAFPGSIQL